MSARGKAPFVILSTVTQHFVTRQVAGERSFVEDSEADYSTPTADAGVNCASANTSGAA